ncbi:hypothetical protein [Pelagibacterium sp.]|uniref:hypothetical protein n=1 Tax=Pelagibacterium sp. TaxID=1967288 RepID=UPI003A93D6EA
MKDFLRLLFIAILSFVIVGVAIAYTRDSDVLTRLTSAVDTSDLPSLKFSKPAPDPVESGSGTEIWIARPNVDQWVGLAGFPDSAELRFALPSGVKLSSGTLKIALDSQLSEDGDGRVTVSLDGIRRGEVVLDPGRSRHEIEIALREDDLLSDALIVTLEGRGTTSGGQICPADATNSGAAITLSADSGLSLFTDDPIDTRAVRIATMADPARMAFGSDTESQALAIWARQDLARKGMAVRFATDDKAPDLVMAQSAGSSLTLDAAGRIVVAAANGTDALRAARMSGTAAPAPRAWPITVDQLNAETLLKNFRGSRRWTVPYSLADLPDGLMPRRFAIDLKTSTLAPGNEWVVRVSLNGHLLETRRFDGQGDTISLSVALPADIQALSNAVLLELIDTSPNESICRVGPDAQAQLLPTSRLTPQGAQPSEGWPQMVRALADDKIIGLNVMTPLSQGAGRTAASVLGAFLPVESEVVFGTEAEEASARIELTTVAALKSALRLAGAFSADTQTIWLVVPNQDVDPTLIALSDPRTSGLIEHLDDDAAVMLIDR